MRLGVKSGIQYIESMPVTLFSKLNHRASVGLKLLGTALVLVACEPGFPFQECGDDHCDKLTYQLIPRNGSSYESLDNSSGAYLMVALPLSITVTEAQSGTTAFRPSPGGRGLAYASCLSCGSMFNADSILFSTDMVTLGGDTLKAGYNFAVGSLPAGFQGGDGGLRIDSLLGFRDSVFEVRFHGTISGAQKSASATFKVPPSLLLE